MKKLLILALPFAVLACEEKKTEPSAQNNTQSTSTAVTAPEAPRARPGWPLTACWRVKATLPTTADTR